MKEKGCPGFMSFSKKLFRIALMASLLTVFCVVSAAAAHVGVGTITADALRLREEADPNASILATANRDDVVVVLEEVDDSWYKVDYKSIEGYMLREYLTVSTCVEMDLGYGRVSTDGSTLNVRSGPDTGYDQITTLYNNAVLSLIGMENGWYKISYKNLVGYVSSDYITICKDSTGARGDGDVVDPMAQQVVEYALQYLGTPYVWGGNGPNCFDCSGFTKYVYSHFGYTLNRTASAQLYNGVAVTLEELQPGDLVFFNNGRVSTPVSHVGIYIGGGQFVHASTNSYRVEISSLSGHFLNTYVYARRLFN